MCLRFSRNSFTTQRYSKPSLLSVWQEHPWEMNLCRKLRILIYSPPDISSHIFLSWITGIGHTNLKKSRFPTFFLKLVNFWQVKVEGQGHLPIRVNLGMDRWQALIHEIEPSKQSKKRKEKKMLWIRNFAKHMGTMQRLHLCKGNCAGGTNIHLAFRVKFSFWQHA